ncbi:hypothetical protein [Mycolicibacterium komossense]|uniref:Uncharacterized protein n=1 Tax=Mycolicibacterium komossense TaxID=1779 RepID=A0ABT3CFL3_9MYCO|nr:hypothetical protein [Mycolicibacterium komossense]MCV7228285.1 hypothetical protein [Mycolicibacterium komossense]
MSGGDTTQIDPTKWGELTTLPPPPGITADTPITGMSPAELAGALLSAAAALDDPKDQADAEAGHTKRTAASADAATQFPEQETQQAGKMDGLGQESQMAQQIPQMLSSVGGALSGAMGGLMQPLTQIPQQLAQTGQQLLQQGMGAMKDAGGKMPEDLAGQGLGGLPAGEDAAKLGEGGGGSGSGGGGGLGTTSPTAMLGPPATPSATTTPTSGRSMPPVAAASGPTPTATQGGMGGMPMMPHGGMGGGGDGKDDKAATKRVAVPSVKNGAPVQGRIATPPSAPTVAKKVDGKTVASKRIVIPSDRANDKAEGDDKDR